MIINNINIISVEMNLKGNISKDDILILNEACNKAEDSIGSSIILIKLSNNSVKNVSEDEINVRLINQWERVLRRLERSCAITITVIESDCDGFGLAVTLCTDYRISVKEARLCMSANNGSILPGTIIHRLVNEVGVAKARQLALFGIKLDVDVAVRLSIIDKVSSDVNESVDDFISSLNEHSVRDFSLRRKLLLESPSISYEEALGAHLAACDRTLRKKVKKSLAKEAGAADA